MFRVPCDPSPLSLLLLQAAHDDSGVHHGRLNRSTQALFLVLSQGFYIPRLQQRLKTTTRNCQRCRLNRALVGHPRHQVRATSVGSSDTISALSDAEYVTQHLSMDISGPLTIQCGATQNPHRLKIYLLLLLNSYGILRIMTLEDYSSDSVVQALSTYINRFGKVTLIGCDAGSTFLPIVTSLTPMASAQVKTQDTKLTEIWATLQTEHNFARLRNAGVQVTTFAQGRHSALGEIEQVVSKVKVFLKTSHLYLRGEDNTRSVNDPEDLKQPSSLKNPLMTQTQLLLALSQIEKFVNSRPHILTADGTAFSIGHLASLRLQLSPLCDRDNSNALSTISKQFCLVQLTSSA